MIGNKYLTIYVMCDTRHVMCDMYDVIGNDDMSYVTCNILAHAVICYMCQVI